MHPLHEFSVKLHEELQAFCLHIKQNSSQFSILFSIYFLMILLIKTVPTNLIIHKQHAKIQMKEYSIALNSWFKSFFIAEQIYESVGIVKMYAFS